MLAHFLALNREQSPFFGDHTFTLLGFSLGSQVCKSTINRLKKLGQYRLIHNVYFMAGATMIKKHKLSAQKNAFIATVAGSTTSLFTTNDKAVTVFETFYGHKAIGRNDHYITDRHNSVSTVAFEGFGDQSVQSSNGGKRELYFKFENFDVGMIAKGHMDYRAKLDLLLEHINF